jgi:hypothetical protein
MKLFLVFSILHLVSCYFVFQKPTPHIPTACYFTGAGFYFWWQMGCAKYMKENCDISKFPMIIGASAGSLTASLLLSNSDLDVVTDVAFDISHEVDLYSRKTGLAGIWGGLVRVWLERIIPEDICADQLKTLKIAVTPSFQKPKLVDGFSNKRDLIDACLASCHVPLFLDGRPYTEYRGEKVIDGSFWYFITKDRFTGLPLPENINVSEIFWIDYVDDEQFMQTISGNFLELSSPEGLHDMVDAGYNYMKREHFEGRLPFVKFQKPNFVTTSSSIVNSVSKIPVNIGKIASSIRNFNPYRISSS